NLSFRRPDEWASRPMPVATGGPADSPVSSTAVLLGDGSTGPALLLLHLPPGVSLPAAGAHGHASDTWRMPLAGTLAMGPDTYGPGDFRFQPGWRPYASDNLAEGPDGGWTALLFGDRRGLRVRPVQPEGPPIGPLDRAAGRWLRIGGDLVSDDPDDAPGPSTLSTTLSGLSSRPGRARVNGSFGETAEWFRFGEGFLAAGLLGHPASGPLLLLARIPDGGRPLGSYTFGTEVLRLVVRGSCRIGDDWYGPGDIRVEHAGSGGPAVAGAGGVDEVVLIADRRALRPGAVRDAAWSAALGALTADLGGRAFTGSAR
ncbi:MAG TPA: hypothetical protein VHL53_02690, partial [Acidimicrobiia bacterium]|nr:hypothetical protein [Acidimicrobiia bacterium]